MGRGDNSREYYCTRSAKMCEEFWRTDPVVFVVSTLDVLMRCVFLDKQMSWCEMEIVFVFRATYVSSLFHPEWLRARTPCFVQAPWMYRSRAAFEDARRLRQRKASTRSSRFRSHRTSGCDRIRNGACRNGFSEGLITWFYYLLRCCILWCVTVQLSSFERRFDGVSLRIYIYSID